MTSNRSTHHALKHSPVRVALTAMSMAFLLISGLFSTTAHASAQSPLVTLPGSAARWIAGAQLAGRHASTDQLTVGIMLRTTNATEQQALLKSLYHTNSPLYHQWLTPEEFSARFAPSGTAVAAVKHFLTSEGLSLVSSPDATLQMARGTASQVEAAFHTTINDYRLTNGNEYYANTSDVQVPANLATSVLGVFGLSNIPASTPNDAIATGATPNAAPPPYGGGPSGSGLTPSQIAGIYDVSPVYKNLHNTGQGVTLAVFELSGYKKSDITAYVNYYKLPQVNVVDKPVLGGPIPIGGSRDYGAAEVELDIELQIAIAPGIKKLLVYNAPNTELGVLAQYSQMAKDNQADSISTSWGTICELFVTSESSQANNQIFLQMALQGQSLFSASGDAGAYGCSRGGIALPSSLALQIGDPNNQPFVTAVGGTAFRTPAGTNTFDPGKNPNPTYPGNSKEETWTRSSCVPENCEGSGGGVSRIWPEPDYATDYTKTGNFLPGVLEAKYSQGGAYCGQQPGLLCRENPDISFDADPQTGYSIYCTDPGDPFCKAGEFGKPGWVRLGGTSCAAPLWAGIGALLDRQVGKRTGLLNYYLYAFDSTAGYKTQLHDISLATNGYYPAAPAYDLATGLGTPNVYYVVKP